MKKESFEEALKSAIIKDRFCQQLNEYKNYIVNKKIIKEFIMNAFDVFVGLIDKMDISAFYKLDSEYEFLCNCKYVIHLSCDFYTPNRSNRLLHDGRVKDILIIEGWDELLSNNVQVNEPTGWSLKTIEDSLDMKYYFTIFNEVITDLLNNFVKGLISNV